MVIDISYPVILVGGFLVAIIIFLLTAVWLLRKILAELRAINETIRGTTTSDIELRLFGSDDD